MTEHLSCRGAERPLIAAATMALAITAIAAPAQATTFSAVTRTEHSGTRMPAFADSEVRAVVDGARGRLEYVRSGLGTPKDRVIVTEDGGRSATFYDAEGEACGDAPTSALAPTGLRAQAAALHRYDNVRVDKKLDTAGAKLHGVKTRHLRYAISYDMSTSAQAPPLHVSIDSELWVAPALKDAALSLWLRAAPQTGDAAADKRIGEGMKDAQGAALKRIERTTLQGKGGAEQTLTTTMEVTQLATGKPAAGSLDPPFVCRSLTPKQ